MEEGKEARYSRIGYYMSESKLKNNSWDLVIEAAKERGLTLIKMDLQRDLEEQGPFDRVLHKMTNELVIEEEEKARKKIDILTDYLSKHPEVYDSEPVDKQRGFLKREKLCELLCEVDKEVNQTNEKANVQCPGFVVLTAERGYSEQLAEAKIQFPVVAKALQACGSVNSHMMGIVFAEEGLRDFQAPILVQEYYNHNSIIFKVFAIGDFIHVVRRPSLKNFDTSSSGAKENLMFNSQEPPPPHLFDKSIDVTDESTWPNPPEEVLQMLNRALQSQLGVHLLGFDVIRRVETGHHAVIDVNFFPSYKGVPGVATRMVDFLVSPPSQPHVNK